MTFAGIIGNRLGDAAPPGEIEQLAASLRECDSRWRSLGMDRRLDREGLCRPEEIRYRKALDYYEGEDMRSHRIVKKLEGYRPCLTTNAITLCQRLCGKDLWELIRREARTITLGTASKAGWTQHPWINGCMRNRMLTRCGPDGIYCWSNSALDLVAKGTASDRRPPSMEPGDGVLLEGCNYGGWWVEMENLKTPLERHRRRIAVLRSGGGFPSIVNLRAEEIPADHLIEQDLRIDIENLSEWEGADQLDSLEILGEPRDPAGIKLELEFTAKILGVIRQENKPDQLQSWAKYAQDLSSRYIQADAWLQLELTPGYIMEQSGNYYAEVPEGTLPFPTVPYEKAEAVLPHGEGLREYIIAVTTHAEEYLSPEKCFPKSDTLAAVKATLEVTRSTYNDVAGGIAEGNLMLLAALVNPDEPPRTPAESLTTMPRFRANRSTNQSETLVNRTVSKPAKEPPTLDTGIQEWLLAIGQRSREIPGPPAPVGLSSELQALWEANHGDQVWGLMKDRAGHYEVIDGNLPGLEWQKTQVITTYDQVATLQLTAPLSPVVDMVDDLVFHLHSGGNGALRAPNRLQDLEGLTDDQMSARLQRFRAFEQASMNHLFEVNKRVATQCRRRLHLAVAQQGFEDAGTPEVITPREARGITSMLAGAIGIGSGIAGYVIGLWGSKPHAGAEVTGLRGAVTTLHSRTSALIRTEGLLKAKLEDTDQGLGATRRGALVNSATLAACEGSNVVVDGLREVRQGRVPLGLFHNVSEMVNVLRELETEVMVPHELALLLDANQYPEQLMLWQAKGFIERAPREQPLDPSQNSPQEWAIGRWSHNNTLAGDLGDGAELPAVAQDDVLDNSFTKNALHPRHAEGMRKDFLTNVWNLKVNVEIPAGSPHDKTYFRLEPAEPLFEANGQVFQLKLDEVLLRSVDGTSLISMSTQDLGTCTQIRLTGRTFCPRRVLTKQASCGISLLEGKMDKSCLSNIRMWPRQVPYCHNTGGGLQFLVYIPEDTQLQIRCGKETLWTPRPGHGLKKVTLQPLCQLRLKDRITTVLPRLDKRGDLWVEGTEVDLGQALKGAEFMTPTKWGRIEAELSNKRNENRPLKIIMDQLDREEQEGIPDYIDKKMSIWGEVVLGAILVFTIIFIMVIWCVFSGRHKLVYSMLEGADIRGSKHEKITDSQGKQLNSFMEKLTEESKGQRLLKGELDSVQSNLGERKKELVALQGMVKELVPKVQKIEGQIESQKEADRTEEKNLAPVADPIALADYTYSGLFPARDDMEIGYSNGPAPFWQRRGVHRSVVYRKSEK